MISAILSLLSSLARLMASFVQFAERRDDRKAGADAQRVEADAARLEEIAKARKAQREVERGGEDENDPFLRD